MAAVGCRVFLTDGVGLAVRTVEGVGFRVRLAVASSSIAVAVTVAARSTVSTDDGMNPRPRDSSWVEIVDGSSSERLLAVISTVSFIPRVRTATINTQITKIEIFAYRIVFLFGVTGVDDTSSLPRSLS